MKRMTTFVLAVALTGCGPALFKATKGPPGTTQQQYQLDGQQCATASERTGPWLFGLGYLAMRSLAKSAYRECMEKKGYTVEPE